MKLIFDIGTVDIDLHPSPATNIIMKYLKHLQHVPVPMRDWDYPFYLDHIRLEKVIEKLYDYAMQLDVEIDPEQCDQQSYLNHLHGIYEKNYNGEPDWLNFHENIHLCEDLIKLNHSKVLAIDYRELAGPLLVDFDRTLIDQCDPIQTPGDVTVGWSELGKTPYSYWRSQEPNDIDRICELAKPHLKLRARLEITTQSELTRDPVDIENFVRWWACYEAAWCKHWNLPSWSLDQMARKFVIGHVVDFDKFLQILESQGKLQRVTL
jgi:hypothetical protein